MSLSKREAGRIGGKASKKRDLVTQMLIVALNEIDPTTQLRKARMLADKLVAKAIEGDVQAAREVLDRVEGKPVQVNENHNISYRATELSDDELAGIAAGSGEGASAPPPDSPLIH